MKIGIVSDVHNNLYALEAVLSFLKKENCDTIICCGDILGIGPYPEETVQRIMTLDHFYAVRGNHDSYLADGPTSAPNMSEGERQYHVWEHALLSQSSKDFIQSLPYSMTLSMDGVTIAALHYCMDEVHHYVNFNPRPTLEECHWLFDGIDADVILFGHTHNALCHQDDSKIYINSGSLGCPAKSLNRASFGILSIKNGKTQYEGCSVEYDAEAVVADIDRLRFPAFEEVKTIFYGR